MLFATPILNREFQFDPNGWIEVLRGGEFPHSSGIVQIIDRQAIDAIVARFKVDKQEPNWPGVLIDRDHYSTDLDKPSEAMGWIDEMRREGESLLAHVEWSMTGEQFVRSGLYRLLSPVFRPEDMDNLGGGRQRPLRLDSVALTNVPNMRGLKPISNRAPSRDVLTPAEIEALSTTQAAARFNIICNRIKKENGWDFSKAWDHCRRTEPALYNRMAAQDRQTPAVAADEERSRFASDALSAMAEEDRRSSGCSFTESWDRVRNRRPDVVLLTNRTAPQSEWSALETAAVSKFSERLDPDGRVLSVGNPEKLVKSFEFSYAGMVQEFPDLTPAQRLEKIKEKSPQVYWSFIFLTAK